MDEHFHEEHEGDSAYWRGHGSLQSYIKGYILSIIVTLVAFYLVFDERFSKVATLFGILSLAILQLWIQLHFFLKLGTESKPRWNTMLFLFGVLVVVIIAGGSLWIMANINYNAMGQMRM